jgi:Tfp pilus assembly protein PilO
VSANTGRLSDAIERLLPFLIVVAIVTFAFFFFIQTPLNAYLRTRTDTAALETRLQTARDSVARAAGTPPVDIQASITLFEKQMASDERVADVTALLAKAVLDSAPADKLRGFVIETSDRIKAEADEGGRAKARPVTTSTVGTSPDPRLSLFPYKVAYTPVKVAFSSTFEGIANFMWKVRDLPTTIEVKSATLTRGMPFMKMEMLIWVYQRGAAISPEPAPVAPGTPAGPSVNPIVPRVAQLTGAEG